MKDLVGQSQLPIGLEAGSAADSFGQSAPPGSDLAIMHDRAFITGFCDQNVEAIKEGQFAQTCTELESKVNHY